MEQIRNEFNLIKPYLSSLQFSHVRTEHVRLSFKRSLFFCSFPFLFFFFGIDLVRNGAHEKLQVRKKSSENEKLPFPNAKTPRGFRFAYLNVSAQS